MSSTLDNQWPSLCGGRNAKSNGVTPDEDQFISDQQTRRTSRIRLQILPCHILKMGRQEDEDQFISDQQTRRRSRIRLQILPWHILKMGRQEDEDHQVAG